MTTATKSKATVTGEGETCGRYLSGLPIRRCDGTTFEYRTDSYTERDGAESWRQHRAIRKCAKCGGRSVVDVAFEVPRVIKTAAQWAAWWSVVDNRAV